MYRSMLRSLFFTKQLKMPNFNRETEISAQGSVMPQTNDVVAHGDDAPVAKPTTDGNSKIAIGVATVLSAIYGAAVAYVFLNTNSDTNVHIREMLGAKQGADGFEGYMYDWGYSNFSLLMVLFLAVIAISVMTFVSSSGILERGSSGTMTLIVGALVSIACAVGLYALYSGAITLTITIFAVLAAMSALYMAYNTYSRLQQNFDGLWDYVAAGVSAAGALLSLVFAFLFANTALNGESTSGSVKNSVVTYDYSAEVSKTVTARVTVATLADPSQITALEGTLATNTGSYPISHVVAPKSVVSPLDQIFYSDGMLHVIGGTRFFNTTAKVHRGSGSLDDRTLNMFSMSDNGVNKLVVVETLPNLVIRSIYPLTFA